MAGERKQQILETLAKMLEAPKREKITTASLAPILQPKLFIRSKIQFFESKSQRTFCTLSPLYVVYQIKDTIF